jgi:hypothetical protein
VIVEEEAEIVRLIYRLFLFGKSASHIANLLMGVYHASKGPRVRA